MGFCVGLQPGVLLLKFASENYVKVCVGFDVKICVVVCIVVCVVVSTCPPLVQLLAVDTQWHDNCLFWGVNYQISVLLSFLK